MYMYVRVCQHGIRAHTLVYPQTLAEAKSYSERFRYIKVERLDRAAAEAAFTQPALDENVTSQPTALDHVIDRSGQYPYFIQQFGQEAWNAASGDQIDMRAAELGVVAGLAQLDTGFFRARWDRTTGAEKHYLRAMCPEGDEGHGWVHLTTARRGRLTPARA